MRPAPAAPLTPAMESHLENVLSNITAAYCDGLNAGTELAQGKVDALVSVCEATLRYLEGPACMEVCDELAQCEGVIAMLRGALERGRA